MSPLQCINFFFSKGKAWRTIICHEKSRIFDCRHRRRLRKSLSEWFGSNCEHLVLFVYVDPTFIRKTKQLEKKEHFVILIQLNDKNTSQYMVKSIL